MCRDPLKQSPSKLIYSFSIEEKKIKLLNIIQHTETECTTRIVAQDIIQVQSVWLVYDSVPGNWVNFISYGQLSHYVAEFVSCFLRMAVGVRQVWWSHLLAKAQTKSYKSISKLHSGTICHVWLKIVSVLDKQGPSGWQTKISRKINFSTFLRLMEAIK